MIVAGIYDHIVGVESLGMSKSILVNILYEGSIYIKADKRLWHAFYAIEFMFKDECLMFYRTGEDYGYYQTSELLEKLINSLGMNIEPNVRIVTYGDNENDDTSVNIFLHASEGEIRTLLNYIRQLGGSEPPVFNL